MAKFKAGDRVRVLDGGHIKGAKIGDIVTVAEVNSRGKITKIEEFTGPWLYNNDWYELVESEGPSITGTMYEPFTNHQKFAQQYQDALLHLYMKKYAYNNLWIDEAGDYNAETNKSKKTIMTKLNTMMKQLLDADTQTLVKAGYINGDLELTSEGRDALNGIVFQQNKAALVALAQEALDEEKAANN